jgi:hypothetical protein
MPRWFVSYREPLSRGRSAAPKKRAVTKKPPSSSVVSLVVLKFARFLFICPVLEALWGLVSEIHEGLCVQSTIAQGSSLIIPFPRPPLALCLAHGLPKAPAGGRAQGRGWDWGARCHQGPGELIALIGVHVDSVDFRSEVKS